ncbi:MAG: RDD family protein [Piscirickettsiaceae bacterium]|nr:RDD family protein [Piscirickettsiaceae bacterium]
MQRSQLNISQETYCRPTLFRHLAIIVYDLLLLLAILLLAGGVAVAFNGGQAIGQGNPFFLLYLFAVSFLFYGWFWTHGGQTLGMRSWKVYIFSNNGSPITWYQAFIRFITAFISCIPLGLGFWWQFLSKNNQSWTNSLSATRIHYSKKSKIKPLSRLS